MTNPNPIVLIGCPRSGTALTMKLLHAAGMGWGPVGSSQLEASFGEWIPLRENVDKQMLAQNGFDPMGQEPLPPKDWYAGDEWVKRVREAVRPIHEKALLDSSPRWGFKALKTAYSPGVLIGAFPNADFVWIERPIEEHIDSLCRTPFMTAYGTDREGWEQYILWHEQAVMPRFERLEMKSFWPRAFLQSPESTRDFFLSCGLVFSVEKLNAVVDPAKFKISIDDR